MAEGVGITYGRKIIGSETHKKIADAINKRMIKHVKMKYLMPLEKGSFNFKIFVCFKIFLKNNFSCRNKI